MPRELCNTSLITTIGSNLRAYYRMEAGALTTDTSGNGNTLTNNNSVGEATGLFGGCADGSATNTDKYLRIDSGISLDGNSDATISCWLKMRTEISSGGTVFLQHFSTGGADRYINVYYDYNGGTRRIVTSFSGTNAFYNINLGTQEWHLITITRDVAGNAGTIWVDGVAGTPSTLGSSALGLNRVSILGAAADSYTSAYMDDVFFASYKLSQSEINQLLSGSMPDFITNRPAWRS